MGKMKARLEFDLPEEKHEFDNALQGSTIRYILWNHLEYLRGKLKHGELSDEQYQAYKDCRDILTQSLMNENIDVY
jgi:hypothetical protein